MIVVTPGMQAVIDHFADLGPRWGLCRETCAVHALLYLHGQVTDCSAVANALGMDAGTAAAAIEDLLSWNMAQRAAAGGVNTSGQPWDMLFAALEERQRREVEPARRLLAAALSEARRDGTSPAVVQRIRALAELVNDLSAIAGQASRFSSRTLTRLVGFGGRVSRLISPSRP